MEVENSCSDCKHGRSAAAVMQGENAIPRFFCDWPENLARQMNAFVPVWLDARCGSRRDLNKIFIINCGAWEKVE